MAIGAYIHALLGIVIAYELFGAPRSVTLLIKTMAEATARVDLHIILKVV